MSCRDIQPRISAQLDAPHTGVDAVIEEHLKVCSSCRTFRAEQQELSLLFEAMAARDPEPPARIWTNIERSILDASVPTQTARPLGGRLLDLFRLPQWGYALAALALFAFAFLSFNQSPVNGELEQLDRLLAEYRPQGGDNPWLEAFDAKSPNPFQGEF